MRAVSDVLVVGAGSAGSIVAERLSADPGCRVTVLEPGPGPGDPAWALTADGFHLPIGPDSPVACRFPTMLTDDPPRRGEVVRGRCVGGSGAVNGGYFWVPQPGDLEPLPGWGPGDVSPHIEALIARIPTRPVTEFSSSTAAFGDAAGRAGRRCAAVPLNVIDGVRLGPGAVFLVPALGRENLTVLTGTRATRVRFAGGRAVGVDAAGPLGPIELAADRVVLCAGAIASAHLLLLSGVGPAGHLRECGITPVVDLPVGRQFRDHPEWVMSTGWRAEDGRAVLEVVLPEDDLEIRPYTTGFGAPTTTLGVALMRPRTHGRLTLVSADPAAGPRLEHRYDDEPADVAGLQRGYDLVREILTGVTELGPPSWGTSQHLCGTAPMGEGEHAVVDPRCRVRGVGNLWVIDGSVLARIPGRGPHATIATVAHRAAEFVR